MNVVILLYPDGQRREVLLSGIPIVGDTIKLASDCGVLLIKHRLFMEAGANGVKPTVLLSVHHQDPEPLPATDPEDQQ